MVLARDGSNVKKTSGADYCIQIYNVMYKLRNLPFYILVWHRESIIPNFGFAITKY